MRRRLAALLFAGVIAGSLAVPGAHAEVVDAADAADHVGSAVTIEGDVAVARSDAEALVLELAPLTQKSFRAVLVRSLFSSLPRAPERVYEGKRVRVTGIVQSFQGRPEMVLESASQIEIVDVAGAPATSATTTPVPAPATTTTTLRPLAPTPPSAATPPPPAPPAAPAASETEAPPVAAAPTPPRTATPLAPPPPAAPPAPPAPPASLPPATVAPSEPAAKPLLSERLAAQACERARAGWTEAAARARAAAEELTRCLDKASFACRESAAKLAPALGDLEWAEQQVADRCD
jgi:hypothetical protein